MKTQADYAKEGTITRPVKAVAQSEGIDPAILSREIAEGSAVIMQRGKRATGIGRGLRTKINVNLGTAAGMADLQDELKKARIAEEFGADTISDLSMDGDIDAIRREIFSCTTLPITTVPVYQAVVEHGLEAVTADDIIAMVRRHAGLGVSSLVVHCVNRKILRGFRKKERLMGMVSKGGSLTSAFMLLHGCDNPFTGHFDELLAICRKHDIVLSLGNTARSGCIHDRRDAMQREEARQNAGLARRAHDAGVQVIIEGAGGHIRNDRIAPAIRYYKRLSPFPLFVAGPLPTDIAAGYDHIAGAVGGSAASAAGADYLCYITPAEHLGLPDPASVKEGLIAFRIAAHIGDAVKYGKDARDREVALLRARLDREGQVRTSLDPDRARRFCKGSKECTMCGKYCAIKIMRDF